MQSDVKIDEYLKCKSLTPEKFSEFLSSFPDENGLCCVCIFMKELFVLDGRSPLGSLKYNFTLNKWSYIAKMNKWRVLAACTAFEGKVVVLGVVIHALSPQKLMIIMKTN